jgi:DNA-binding PadR family transcriptional regulator
MAVRDAVLGLVVERRGYGYELFNRFNERFGEAWQLNQATIYEALDKLEQDGLVVSFERQRAGQSRGRARRSRIVVYEALPGAEARFLTWLTAPAPAVEAIRGEVLLKIGMTTRREHALALIQVIDAQIDVCANTLAVHLSRYQLDPDTARRVPWTTAATWFMTELAIGKLQAELTWLRRVRAAAEELRAHGAIPLTMLAARPDVPPGWS